jgi:hypothetical protein
MSLIPISKRYYRHSTLRLLPVKEAHMVFRNRGANLEEDDKLVLLEVGLMGGQLLKSRAGLLHLRLIGSHCPRRIRDQVRDHLVRSTFHRNRLDQPHTWVEGVVSLDPERIHMVSAFLP